MTAARALTTGSDGDRVVHQRFEGQGKFLIFAILRAGQFGDKRVKSGSLSELVEIGALKVKSSIAAFDRHFFGSVRNDSRGIVGDEGETG